MKITLAHFRGASVAVATALATILLCSPLAAQGGEFSDRIEAAHGGESWSSKAAIEVPIRVEFGGKTMVDGVLTTDTPVGHTRIELKDGTVLVFDGQDAWVSPADSEFQGARFHALTWPYFLAAPFKLDDPGSNLEALGARPFQGDQSFEAARLTFGAGVGDSPDDWYVVYRDDSDRLAAMAYIVTLGKDVEEAEKAPHAIVYGDWVEVDGVAIPTRWKFYDWNEEEGVVGDPIGMAELGTPRFVDPAEDAFTKPEGARKEAAPGK